MIPPLTLSFCEDANAAFATALHAFSKLSGNASVSIVVVIIVDVDAEDDDPAV